jgi:bifunctional non-homologous end joining protein LigD
MAKAAPPSPPRRRKTPLPVFRPLQLATLVDAAPGGGEWVHEVKYDGYRILLSVGAGQARTYTRSGLDWSDKFAPIIAAAGRIKAQLALIDGEAVVLDDEGRSSFQLMQGAFKAKGAKLVFYAFDLLERDGEDLTRLPLIDRKKQLAQIIGRRSAGAIRYSDHIAGHGDEMFKAACKQGLEGIISKRADGRYIGARTESWLKIKCLKRQEFVIAGWTTSDKDRGFRSLILAVNERGKLRYAGKVGTGFNMAEIDRLVKRMRSLARTVAPVEAPRAAVKGAHWIEPKLVAEIAFTEMTSDGILRHPSYMGLREDKAARDVVVERPKTTKAMQRKKAARKKPKA